MNVCSSVAFGGQENGQTSCFVCLLQSWIRFVFVKKKRQKNAGDALLTSSKMQMWLKKLCTGVSISIKHIQLFSCTVYRFYCGATSRL